MNETIQRAVRSVQLAVLATPTRSLVDALAEARRGSALPTMMRLARADHSSGRSIAAGEAA